MPRQGQDTSTNVAEAVALALISLALVYTLAERSPARRLEVVQRVERERLAQLTVAGKAPSE